MTPDPTALAATATPVRIAIVNDYELVVQGVRMMLAPWADRIQVVELDLNASVRRPVDIALYDTFGQDRSAIQKVRLHLRDAGVQRVVVYSWQFTRETAQAMLGVGVSAVISKRLPAARLAGALLDVAAGRTVVAANGWSLRESDPTAPTSAASYADWPGREYGLTMREAEMIALITQGLTNVEIARRAFISGNTVKSYIRAAYRKIGVTRRSQAVAWGLRHNMTPQVGRILMRPEAVLPRGGLEADAG